MVSTGSCVPLVCLLLGIFPTDASEPSLIVETSCLGIFFNPEDNINVEETPALLAVLSRTQHHTGTG